MPTDPENPMSLPPQSNSSHHDNIDNNDNNIKTPGSLPATPSSQHLSTQQHNPQQNMGCRPLSNMASGGLHPRGRPQSTGVPEGVTNSNPGGHFMSQQSQIFVFSTGLANEAAEVVQRGQCRSIVDFHLDTPATRQFLQVLCLLFPMFF